MDDTMRIDSPKAAAALAQPQSRRILLKLVANEASLQDLAHATALSLSHLHYHVARLLRLGLVRIVGWERRAGRPIKRYRAVARIFFVPAGLATDHAGEALARELRAGLERDSARRDDAGVAYLVDDAGIPRMRRIQGGSDPRALEVWTVLSLTPDAVRDLNKEITALFARYANRGDPGACASIAYCAVAARR